MMIAGVRVAFCRTKSLKGFRSSVGAASILKLPSLESQVFLECSLHLCASEFNTDLHGSDPDGLSTLFSTFMHCYSCQRNRTHLKISKYLFLCLLTVFILIEITRNQKYIYSRKINVLIQYAKRSVKVNNSSKKNALN